MYTDFDWALNLNRLMLDLFGVWPSYNEKDLSRNARVPFVILWQVFGLILPQLYALVRVRRELPLVVDNILTSCACSIAAVKLFVIWYNRPVIKMLVTSMTNDWAMKKSTSEYEMMIKQARRGRLFTISGYLLILSNASYFLLLPFFNLSMRIINNITDIDEKRFFPLQTYYPYEFTRSPYFEITYFTQFVALIFAGFSFSAADNFFGAVVFHASGQCEILSSRMTRLFSFVKPSGQALTSQKTNHSLFKFQIRQIVKTHIYLTRFVFAIEKSFNTLILAHTIGLSIVICCTGYGVLQSLRGTLSFARIFSLVGTIMNLLIHLFVYCCATESLTINSTEFLEAIYNCNWYMLPSKFTRDIIVIMIQSHYPLRLTAGKFFYLSLNAFLQVLKTSAGYISMLAAVS